MYNPKPQTRNEIMWAAMAGRDFDLDEKGRFEMFMSDVAERINAGGGGAFMFNIVEDPDTGDLTPSATPEEIVAALEAGKVVLIKAIYRTEEEGEVFESDTYYTLSTYSVDDGVLTECVGVVNRPKYDSSTASYNIYYIHYTSQGGWMSMQTACSPQLVSTLGASSKAVITQSGMTNLIGDSTPSGESYIRSLISNAFDEWYTLAGQNAGKTCVASAVSTEQQVIMAMDNFCSTVFVSYGRYNVFNESLRFYRPVVCARTECSFVRTFTYTLVPCSVTVRFLSEQDRAVVQIIGALPLDA